MHYRTIRTLIMVLIVFSIVSCGKSAENAFKEVEKKNTIAAYEEFIKKYSESDLSKNAQLKIYELAYREAQEKDSIRIYEQFVKKYPNNEFKAKANQRIKELSIIKVPRSELSHFDIKGFKLGMHFTEVESLSPGIALHEHISHGVTCWYRSSTSDDVTLFFDWDKRLYAVEHTIYYSNKTVKKEIIRRAKQRYGRPCSEGASLLYGKGICIWGDVNENTAFPTCEDDGTCLELTLPFGNKTAHLSLYNEKAIRAAKLCKKVVKDAYEKLKIEKEIERKTDF